MDTQTNLGVDWMHLTGRLFLACVFAASAYDKFLRAPGEVQVVTSLHIPAPRTVLVLVGVFETLGALALVIGIYARQASVLLALFMAVISLAVLRFWSPAGGPEARAQKWNGFVANVAIVGGLFYVIASGPGRFSWEP